MEMKTPAPGTLSNKPQQQPLSQHPVMNQYNSYYQQQKESFYDIPNKYRLVVQCSCCCSSSSNRL